MMADYWLIVLFQQTVWAESRLRVRKLGQSKSNFAAVVGWI